MATKHDTTDRAPRDYVRLTNISRGNDDLEAGFKHLASRLCNGKRQATLQFRLRGGDKGEQIYALHLMRGDAHVTREAVPAPSVEIVTRESTWRSIASGALSPVQAALDLQLSVNGSLPLAFEMLQDVRGEGSREVTTMSGRVKLVKFGGNCVFIVEPPGGGMAQAAGFQLPIPTASDQQALWTARCALLCQAHANAHDVVVVFDKTSSEVLALALPSP